MSDVSSFSGPYRSEGNLVISRAGNGVAACLDAEMAAKIAADLNLADSLAAEPNIDATFALHRRDGGASIRVSTRFCAAVLPSELEAAMDRGDDAAKLLGIRTGDVVEFKKQG